MAEKREPVIEIRSGVSNVRVRRASHTVVDGESKKVLLKVER